MKTAVEWLLTQIENKNGKEFSSYYTEFIEQAKAMEKEQHDKTAEEWWKEGAHYMESGGRAKWESFEQYYNETYESNEATENLNISDVSDSVYFIRVSVKIDKSLYNRTADIKDIVRTELMSAEIKGVLWNYKIEQIDSGDGKDWEFLVNFFTKMNKTQIQNYFDRNTLGSENYQVL